MAVRQMLGLGLIVGMAACADSAEDEPAAEPQTMEAPATPAPTTTAATAACQPMVSNMPLEGRVSPYDSTMVDLGGAQAKVCYGRPAVRERDIFGGLVPYDTIWRTGANEPTTIHVPVRAEIAGIAVEPGSYTLYTVPGRERWTVIVNRSTRQWGIESAYSPEVRAQEVGRAQVPAEPSPSPVDTFTIAAQPSGSNAAELVLSWERTRVRIPIRRA